MKRISLLGFSLLALVLLGAGCFTTTVKVPVDNANTNTNGNVKGAETAALTIPLTITKGSGDPVQYEVSVQPDTTALALLRQASTEHNFAIHTKTYSFGDLVDGIDGITADDTHFWSFYVNGTAAAVGAGDYKIQAGDKIEFRFEKS